MFEIKEIVDAFAKVFPGSSAVVTDPHRMRWGRSEYHMSDWDGVKIAASAVSRRNNDEWGRIYEAESGDIVCSADTAEGALLAFRERYTESLKGKSTESAQMAAKHLRDAQEYERRAAIWSAR